MYELTSGQLQSSSAGFPPPPILPSCSSPPPSSVCKETTEIYHSPLPNSLHRPLLYLTYPAGLQRLLHTSLLPACLCSDSVLPQGTIVVVTHNRRFCELLEPTHLATVLGEPGAQTVKVEERPLRASDWEGADDGDSASGMWLPWLLACMPWPALLLKSPTATPYDNSHPTLFFFPVCPSPSPSSPLSLPSGPSR